MSHPGPPTGPQTLNWFSRLSPTKQSLLVIFGAMMIGAGGTAVGKDWWTRQSDLPSQVGALSVKIDSLGAKVTRFEDAMLIVGALSGRVEVVEIEVAKQRRRMTLMCLQDGRPPAECVE